MKFGKQLQLGIYEPWKSYYIQYGKLKRIIKRRRFLADREEDRKQKLIRTLSGGSVSGLQMVGLNSGEQTPLTIDRKAYLQSSYASSPAFDGEGEQKFDESIDFFPVIIDEMNKVNNFYIGKLASLRVSLDEILNERRNVYRSHHTSSDSSYLLRLRGIYVDLAALRSFCELNKTGFYKIIKKYDKVMGESNVENWMRTIDRQSFSNQTEPIQLMDTVTSLVSRDKLIEWERFATEQQMKVSDDIFPSVRFSSLIISLTLFIISLFLQVGEGNDLAASRCLSLAILSVCLWVTEAIPYFATALLIPVLVVLMRVLKSPSNPTHLLSAEESATFVIDHMFNHTTVLLLGGFTISTAFSRCQLELRIASILQEHLGAQPHMFILAVMFLGLFLSMWISNHTAPILCATIILPIVRDLPTESRFSKTLLLGLAFACNFGGMMTPISSLQNVLAVQYLEQLNAPVSFGVWLVFSVPFCVVCTIMAWLLLILIVNPDDVSSIPIIVYERTNVFGKRNTTVMVLSLLTLLLFAFFNFFKDIFGDIAIVSLCFICSMFGTGMLSEVDFNSMSWHTLFLVGGGNVLGKAIASSGLLGYLSDAITLTLPLSQPWLAFAMILCFCNTTATFVSHTVASLILMPIIASIGMTLDMPQEVVIGSAFAISAAMALPFSSFPNVNSLLIVDDFQQPFLSVQDFLKTGLVVSLVTLLLIATLGFLLIHFLTFKSSTDLPVSSGSGVVSIVS